MPRAVHAPAGRIERVVVADAPARAAGIRPGQPVASALALLPALLLQPREPHREVLRLATLARRCLPLTPCISLAGDALLLEVRASLRFAGGLPTLVARLHRCLADAVVTITAAPTARAALWLARAGVPGLATAPATLPATLAPLPVACTDWPAATLELLHGLGIRTLGEVARLPRAGLARRLGRACLAELDQAYGHAPELLDWHRPAEDFHAVAELSLETADSRRLLAAAEPLLFQLAAELRRRQAGVQSLWCSLEPSSRSDQPMPPIRLRVALRRPARHAVRLRELLALRLNATTLPAPVAALTLQASLVPDSAGDTADWLGGNQSAADRLLPAIERLQARFGPTAVRSLALHADHRPEQAWRWVAPPAVPAAAAFLPAGRRPPWLLPAPRRLQAVADRPVWRGPLTLTDGPERIETGWWDGDDVRRDYFVAATARGRSLWVFRDLRAGHWYLHGVFR